MVERLINDVLKIINNFSETQSDGNKFLVKNIKQINVELIKEKDYCSILATHCSLKNINHSSWIKNFKKLIGSSSKTIKRTVSVLLKEVNCVNELTFNFPQLRKRASISEKIHYPHLKEYLSVKIKQKLSQAELERFGNEIIENLKKISEAKIYTVYTFYWEGEIVYKNETKLDEILDKCDLLGPAMSKVIMLSLNTDFMEECCNELKIEDPGKIPNASTMRLFSLFHDIYNTYED